MSTTTDAASAAAPDSRDLLARREAAIEESGWGSRFDFFRQQPNIFAVCGLFLVFYC